MLGEIHSLINDFPEYQNVIETLNESNPEFLQANKKYNALDKEIRSLELRAAPISDDDMLQLKHNRAELKDALYNQIVASS